MNLEQLEQALRGRRVAVTGHTGFTGGWLSTWLNMLEAKVYGLSLEPNTNPSLFRELSLEGSLSHTIGDICQREAVSAFFKDSQPEVVFHLAAQPIVSVGYDDPHLTFNTNVMGTLNVLEAAKNQGGVKAVVCVTTDKVYRNDEWCWGYREIDPLGGKDPYSASKSACEMVVQTYQKAICTEPDSPLIASARGGNIIGGGDWAENRIVPDFVRAQAQGAPLMLRNPSATRPWQHVLALVHGYFLLAGHMLSNNRSVVDAWNFGPAEDGERSVRDLVEGLNSVWSGCEIQFGEAAFSEAKYLAVSSEKARKELGWVPGIDFNDTVLWTGQWYRDHVQGNGSAHALIVEQINQYRDRIA